MLTFEIAHRGYVFPCTLLSNGKKLVDFYASASFFDEQFEEIKYEVKQILGIEV